ncbi:hypothetical protein [Marinoscillum furvescens]|uniref:Uncharacterized protein n=1 Tax=Marinoscillum furvescens DSM 4134 TaxID=1122208 RepID=A0A3D9L6R1_MARFU|nr:hypothetical protein [Marinoscillum furvescens]REE01164.1 hypothetical protein C7460_104184 [Marinoscillum furvescens DSM 4134]
MNTLRNLLFAGILMVAAACETNNIFNELGTTDGSIVANVYLETFAPSLQAGITKDLEVQYWSLDDRFDYLGLWDYVTVTREYIVTVEGVEFSTSENEDFQDWTEVSTYNFDFADWDPELSAYKRSISYDIKEAYDNATAGSDELTADQYLAAAPENYLADMYSHYTSNLSRATLNELMLEYEVMTQAEFDGHYAESGFLTTDGRAAMEAGLAQIGAKELVGDSYSITSEYAITLAFRATNSTGEYNESRRSFLVF